MGDETLLAADPNYLADRETTTHEESIWLGWALWQVLRLRLGLDGESRKNLQILNSHLEEGSAVVYTHHDSKWDAFFYPVLIRSQLPSMRRALGPIGRAQYVDRQRELMDLVGSKLRVHVMPVMRDKMVKPEDYKFGDSQEVLNGVYQRQMNNVADSVGGVLGIAPGGGRYGFKKLTPEQISSSFLRYGERRPNLIYVPMAMHRGFPRRVVEVGVPFFLSELGGKNREERVWPAMNRIAMLLPEGERGVFG